MSFYVGVTNKKTLIVKINDIVIFCERELKNLANLVDSTVKCNFYKAAILACKNDFSILDSPQE